MTHQNAAAPSEIAKKVRFFIFIRPDHFRSLVESRGQRRSWPDRLCLAQHRLKKGLRKSPSIVSAYGNGSGDMRRCLRSTRRRAFLPTPQRYAADIALRYAGLDSGSRT